MTDSSHGQLRKLLSQPLVQFFLVGALVFGAYSAMNDEPETINDHTIEISANDVRRIAIGWLSQGRPMPTLEQMQSLVDQRVAEEVLFREGMALGLDRNDEIIKRRVAQKMDFLAADMAAMQAPETAELKAWYSRHSSQFAVPPRISFRHLYFSPDERGQSARTDALSAFNAIAGKTNDMAAVIGLGDTFMLRDRYSDSTPGQILKEFGPGFSSALFQLEPGGWRGPVESGFGWHLIWIDRLEPGRTPEFAEVAVEVKEAWTRERYVQLKREALEEMLARYTVVVPPLESVDMSDLLDTRRTSAVASDAAL